jgi:hypothetical protein
MLLLLGRSTPFGGTMNALKPKLDKFDLKLLDLVSDKVFEFTKTSAQEQRCHELVKHGLLERKNEVYRVWAGGERMELRWSYRRTKTGTAALKAAP